MHWVVKSSHAKSWDPDQNTVNYDILADRQPYDHCDNGSYCADETRVDIQDLFETKECSRLRWIVLMKQSDSKGPNYCSHFIAHGEVSWNGFPANSWNVNW